MTPDVLWTQESGEGTPLLFLHGLGMSGEAFSLMDPLLRENARLIMPDLRGHGRSAHLPEPYTTDMLAADLVPTLDAHGIDAVHVVGHSHGGAVAQEFARMHPERVRSLILVASYPVQRLTWWQQVTGQALPPVVTILGTKRLARAIERRRAAGGGRKLSPAAAALAAGILAGNDRRNLTTALQAARHFDSRDWLDSLQIPTLVIAGHADCLVVPRQPLLLAAGIPGARAEWLAHGGHALPLSHPDELAALIAVWLAEQEHSASGEGGLAETA